VKSLGAIVVAFALLAVPAAAAAQEGSAFGPLEPSGPLSAPDEPAPTQPLAPAPSAPMPLAPPPEDNELNVMESLAFAGIAVLLLGGVGVAIAREGRELGRRDRRAQRTRAAALRRRGAPGCRPRAGVKAPPPPPRRRRGKARRRAKTTRR
jgi:hypothetical protein